MKYLTARNGGLQMQHGTQYARKSHSQVAQNSSGAEHWRNDKSSFPACVNLCIYLVNVNPPGSKVSLQKLELVMYVIFHVYVKIDTYLMTPISYFCV